MDRWTSIIGAAAAVTVAAGAFAVARAVTTDDPLPSPVAAATTSVAPTTAAATTTPSAYGPTTAPAATAATTLAPATADAVEIEISGFTFSPGEITVARGTTVTWTNNDGVDHAILSEDGSVLSPPMGDGDTFSFTFDSAGVFPYICTFHPEMTGTIIVEG